jgi:hypothetical protein
VGSGGGMWDLRCSNKTRAGRGALTAGGGEWRTAAALRLRNPSERKREKTLTYCLEREIEERCGRSSFVEIGPSAGTRNSIGPHSSDTTQIRRSQRSRSRPSLKLVVHFSLLHFYYNSLRVEYSLDFLQNSHPTILIS